MNYGINTFMDVVKEDISWVVLRKEDAEGYMETVECLKGTYNAGPLLIQLKLKTSKPDGHI